MPVFNIQIMQQCQQIDTPTNIGGYRQFNLGRENLWPSCTCPAFVKKKTGTTIFGHRRVALPCKHINQAQAAMCTWHQLTGPAQTDEQENNKICPSCGGPTQVVKVAV